MQKYCITLKQKGRSGVGTRIIGNWYATGRSLNKGKLKQSRLNRGVPLIDDKPTGKAKATHTGGAEALMKKGFSLKNYMDDRMVREKTDETSAKKKKRRSLLTYKEEITADEAPYDPETLFSRWRVDSANIWRDLCLL